VRPRGERHPQVGGDVSIESPEPILGNARDDEHPTVQIDRPADDVRIGAEPLLPEAPAHHGDIDGTGCAVDLVIPPAARAQPHVGHSKHASRDELRIHLVAPLAVDQ
jgi:hypothetical protein